MSGSMIGQRNALFMLGQPPAPPSSPPQPEPRQQPAAVASDGPWTRYAQQQQSAPPADGPWTRYQQQGGQGGAQAGRAPLASDGNGNFLTLGQDGQWAPAPKARNPETGAELVLVGGEWRDPASLTSGQGGGSRQERSLAQEAGRQLGLTARVPLDAAAGMADFFANGAAAVGNIPFAAWDAARGNAPGTSEPFGYNVATRGAEALAGAVGLPTPQHGIERPVNAAAQAVMGAAPFNAARSAAAGVGRLGSAAWDALTIRTTGEAVANAAAGAASQAAADAAPESWAPVAGLAAGAGVVGVPVAAGALARGTGRAVSRAAEPFTAAGQERIAANRLQDAASNPAAVRERLSQGPVEIVPGSAPTTAQQTGDMGLLGLERGFRTRAPEAFMTRAAEQNAARLDEIQRLRGGGEVTAPAALARQQLDGVTRQGEAQVGAARQAADQAAQGIGGDGTPEGYGSQMRGMAAEAEAAARQAENRAWQQVDPGGSLVLDVAPIRQAAQQITQEITPSAAPMSGRERQIFDVAGSYGDALPFNELAQLRQNVNSALSEELASAGRTPSYARLSRFRGAIEDALNSAAERQQARNASAYGVPAGGSVADRLNPAAFPPEMAPQGFPTPRQAAPAPNFGPEDAARLQAASQTTRQRADTFNRGPMGEVLRRGERADTFRMADAAVPDRIFTRGPQGAANVRSFREAVSDAQALPALREAAAMSLRRAAIGRDGRLDPAQVDRWRRVHSDALREVPGLDDTFSSLARAEDAVAEAMAQQRQQLQQFEGSALARLLGRDTPEEAVAAVGGMLTGGRDGIIRLRQLSQQIGSNQPARDGVRRAIVEHMQRRFIGTAEAGTTGQASINAGHLQRFIRDNQAGLGLFLDDAQLRSMNAVALDLQQSARSMNAVRLPGGSNTAQDLNAASKLDNPSFLRGIIGPGLGAVFGGGVGGAIGSGFGAVIGQTIATLRRNGLQNANEILTEAMLDPALARVLLMKATPQNDARAAAGLARILARGSAVGVQQ